MNMPGNTLAPVRRLAVLALTLSFAGCAAPAAPSYIVNVPFSATDVTVGTGDEALVGKWVVVDYSGWLYDGADLEKKGRLFDSTFNPNRDVINFQLGAGQVIAGWEQGVPGMKVLGNRRLIIPPALAYGSTGNGPIPPNATLVFEIFLLGVFDVDPGE